MKMFITVGSLMVLVSLATAAPARPRSSSSPSTALSILESITATISGLLTPAPKFPSLCRDPTQSQPAGCLGNLIQIRTASNPSLVGQYAYVPPADPAQPHSPGASLSFTRQRSLANTFNVIKDVYGNVFLNASQTNRYAFWSPATQAQNTSATYWPVNFLDPLYGSTQIVPSFDSTSRALGLEIKQYGAFGQLVADAKVPHICGSDPPVLVLSTAALPGCANATLQWVG